MMTVTAVLAIALAITLQSARIASAAPGEPPAVSNAFAVDVTATSATLSAEVAPLESPTTYYVEYGTSIAYGSDDPQAPGAEVGDGAAPVEESVHLQSLQPSTAYHYRVVAVNNAGTTHGDDQTFTTDRAEAALSLPDGRRWELVSPPNKYDANLEPPSIRSVQAAESGDAITYWSNGPISPESPAAPILNNQLLAKRVAGSWQTEDITPRIEEVAYSFQVAAFKLFSPDLSSSLRENSRGHP